MRLRQLWFSLAFLSLFIVVASLAAHGETAVAVEPVAVGALNQVNEYYSTQAVTFSDGRTLERQIISGPPTPPPGYDAERAPVSPPADRIKATFTLTAPAMKWVFGCSAVSGAMIAGYYDRTGYPNMYTGPTDSGQYPLTDANGTLWGTWTDTASTSYPNNPLVASHKGVDGRGASLKGSIDDYWVSYDSAADDPYITGSWTAHTWGDAVGDYMKTSQSAHGNTDGSSTFWNYTSSATKLYCADMTSCCSNDGTLGRKQFYEAKSYTVTDCYNQNTDNRVAGGFNFTQYKAEIDAGRPVMLNLAGHTIVGVGYDDSTNTAYIHDTWDNAQHSMTWGGSYSGMALQSVSIVNLQAAAPVTTHTLSVTKGSTYGGGGTVTSNPAGINCGSTCSASFTDGTITLTATADAYSVFTGWSGAGCSGTGTCVINLTADTSVTANFANACTYKLAPVSRTFTYRGGFMNVTVIARGLRTCKTPEVAVSDSSWGMTAVLNNFTRTRGTVRVTVPANTTTSPRSSTFTLYDQTFSVSEAGAPCNLTIAPVSTNPFLTNAAQTGTYAVTATTGCSWASTVLAGGTWSLGIVSGTGTGNGTVTFSVPQNTTNRRRIGTIKTYLTTGAQPKPKVFRVIQNR